MVSECRTNAFDEPDIAMSGSSLNSKSYHLNNATLQSVNKEVHYNSTPTIIDELSTTIPTKKSSKMIAVQVIMLDDNSNIFHVQTKALGRVLFEEVCKQLNLLEADYFGLEYKGVDNILYWLDLEKEMNRQISLSLIDVKMKFCVKFYTPDPAQLEEEYTRYLFCLNIKRDLSLGSLQCNDNTAALIASYIVQAGCGDFVPEDYPDHTYLSCYKFIPNQTETFLYKIMENHKKHFLSFLKSGQSPAEADLNVLETARRCELYGIKMHPAKDCDGDLISLSVAHMGILVFQNLTKINTFSWAKIRKISFKRKRFLIKLHTKEYGCYKDIVEFFFDSRNECKNFWKRCVEHHSFYRCMSVKHVSRHRRRVLSRGSSFRYSGKTQKEVVEFVRENFVRRQTFQRSTSFRHSAFYSSSTNVSTKPFGPSVSAHPLIPLIDSDADEVIENLFEKLALQNSHLDLNSNRIISDPIIGQVTPTVRLTDTTNINGITKTANNIPCKEPVNETPEKVTITVETAAKNEQTGVNKNIEINKSEILANDDEPLSKFETNSVINSETKSTIVLENGIKNKDDIKKSAYIDPSFHIIKELFLTEITFKKDLDVINLWFREEVGKEAPPECCFLLSLMSPLAGAHYQFLNDLELRLYGKDGHYLNADKYEHTIGDILLQNFKSMKPLYEDFIENNYSALERLNQSLNSNSFFEKLYFEFENQKACYLPFSSFILKPFFRISQYRTLIKNLLKMYGEEHSDYENCSLALSVLDSLMHNLESCLDKSLNFVVLFELQNVIHGLNLLTTSHRKFIRQGCLLKLSHRGNYTPFMFILMTDVLVYLARDSDNLNFYIKGYIDLKNARIENCSNDADINAFIIHTGNKSLVLVTNSYSEQKSWFLSIEKAITDFQSLPEVEINVNFNNFESSDDLNKIEQLNYAKVIRTSQKSNRAIYISWHRFISITINDYLRSAEAQLSGYLLRRFKAHNGWQKLWVVYSNYFLFFYKYSTDDFPLASLPILGYNISIPKDEEFENKENIFELKYKKNVYLLRAESDYSQKRWMDVLKDVNCSK